MIRRRIRWGRGALVLLWVGSAVLPGCAPAENLPECAPVTGKVTLDGEPIVGAMVTFHPEKPGNTGQASSESDGTYILNTYGTHDGALVGKHTVTIERYLPPMPTQPGGKLPSSKATVPQKYAKPETSPFKVEVKSGTNNVIDLPMAKN